MIHNIDTLPARIFRDNMETDQQLLDRLRTSMLDQYQQSSEEMVSRMALRYRDAPEAWRNEKDHMTWWVFLIRKLSQMPLIMIVAFVTSITRCCWQNHMMSQRYRIMDYVFLLYFLTRCNYVEKINSIPSTSGPLSPRCPKLAILCEPRRPRR